MTSIGEHEAAADHARRGPRPDGMRWGVVAVAGAATAIAATFAVSFVVSSADDGDADPAAPSVIAVSDALVAETPVGFAAAVYLTIEQGGGDDRLRAARSPVAGRVTLHRMEPVDGGGLMLPADDIELAAGSTVSLAPFGSHVMLEELTEPLVAGDTVPITLQFERHDDIDVAVEVIDLERLTDLADDGAATTSGSDDEEVEIG